MPWDGRGSNRAWRKLRLRILGRDGGRCQLRLPGCRGRATTVHHLVAWTGDPAQVDPAHLLAACAACNHTAGDPRHADPEPRHWPL